MPACLPPCVPPPLPLSPPPPQPTGAVLQQVLHARLLSHHVRVSLHTRIQRSQAGERRVEGARAPAQHGCEVDALDAEDDERGWWALQGLHAMRTVTAAHALPASPQAPSTEPTRTLHRAHLAVRTTFLLPTRPLPLPVQ